MPLFINYSMGLITGCFPCLTTATFKGSFICGCFFPSDVEHSPGLHLLSFQGTPWFSWVWGVLWGKGVQRSLGWRAWRAQWHPLSQGGLSCWPPCPWGQISGKRSVMCSGSIGAESFSRALTLLAQKGTCFKTVTVPREEKIDLPQMQSDLQKDWYIKKLKHSCLQCCVFHQSFQAGAELLGLEVEASSSCSVSSSCIFGVGYELLVLSSGTFCCWWKQEYVMELNARWNMRLQGGVFPACRNTGPLQVAPGLLQTGLFWERGFALQVPGSLCPFSRKPPRMLWAENTGRAGGAASVRGQFASFVSVQWLLFPSVSQRRIKGPERMKYQTAFYSYLLIAYREFNLDTMSDIVYIL